MLPTTITSEMTKLKEKVRVMEVRLTDMYIVYVGAFCSFPNVSQRWSVYVSLHAMASISMCCFDGSYLKYCRQDVTTMHWFVAIIVTCEPHTKPVWVRSWNQSSQKNNVFWSSWSDSWELSFFLLPQGPFSARRSPIYNGPVYHSPASGEQSKQEDTPVSWWLYLRVCRGSLGILACLS